jgi:hypothetical protein
MHSGVKSVISRFKIALAAAIVAAALATSPAMAQWGYAPPNPSYGWNSQTFGGQTYYNGTGAAQGWNGMSQNFGNQTYSNFNGPNGQHHNCTTQQFGQQVYTNCY